MILEKIIDHVFEQPLPLLRNAIRQLDHSADLEPRVVFEEPERSSGNTLGSTQRILHVLNDPLDKFQFASDAFEILVEIESA